MDERAMTLRDRVAIVSGGGKGIGRAISLRLAHEGAAVAVTYVADAGAAEDTVGAVLAAGGTASAYQLAAERPAEADEVARRVAAELGVPTLLVNNAGVPSPGRPVVDTDPDDAARVFSVNAMSAYQLSRAVLPAMRSVGGGDIVMISSRATDEPGAGRAAYSMAKAAVEMLARVLAIEELPYGIRVNTVAPGFVDTAMGRTGLQRRYGVDDPTVVDTLASHAPFGRFCSVDDVAGVVAFLVSPAGSYLTGQRIGVDGGGTTALFAGWSGRTLTEVAP